METKTHEYLRQHQLSEVSILDLIRHGIGRDDIVNTIVDLYRKKEVVLSFGGSYPFNAYPISVHPSKWEEYQKDKIGNSILRGMYRNGILKKEVIAIRDVMWGIVKECFSYRIDEVHNVGSYTHPAAWTFVRTTNRFVQN